MNLYFLTRLCGNGVAPGIMRKVHVIAAVHHRTHGQQWFPRWHNVNIYFPEKKAKIESVLTLA